MPKSKRDLIKRMLAYTFRNSGFANTHIHELYTLFEEQHPEDAEILKFLEDTLVMVGVTLNTLSNKWNGCDIDIKSWIDSDPKD